MTYKLIVAYDGTRYKGWQRLKTQSITIQEKLESTLSKLLDMSLEVHGSGRTDAGVHAMGQVVSFKVDRQVDSEWLKSELNRYLPDDIVIISAEAVHETFHARLNAKRKVYTYQVWTSDVPPVFERHYVHNIEGRPYDLERMKSASRLLIGTHDFKGFSTDKTKKSTVRTIESIKFVQDGKLLKIEFVGNGFLYNMVRILVGTLLEIGFGTRAQSSIEDVLKTGIRAEAGETAPAKGLFLTEVIY